MDHDIFATKLLEIGPGQASHLYTGRVTVFPNSMPFTNALVKENPVQEYGLYILVIPLKDKDDWRDAERHLLEAEGRMYSLYGRSRPSDEVVKADDLLEAPSPEPGVTIQLSETGTRPFGAAIPGTRSGTFTNRAGHPTPVSRCGRDGNQQ